MAVRGWATGAEWQPQGSELTAAVTAGSIVLPVEWTDPFDDEGGSLVLNGNTYTYTSVDEDASVINLATGLLADASEDDPVGLVEAGQVLTDYILVVTNGEDESIEVDIPFGDRDLWPEGVYLDPVPVLLSDDLERVEDVPGRAPVRDGSFIDPETLPSSLPTTDGDPPSESPTLEAFGGIGQMFFRWDEIDNADPVTYRLHVRAGSAPTTADDTYFVGGGSRLTSLPVRRLADGTPVVGDGSVTYYGIVVPWDADGQGPDSNTAADIPAQVNSEDIAADAITADMLVFNDALGEALSVTDLSAVNFESVNIEGGSIAIAVDESSVTSQAFSGTSLPGAWDSDITRSFGSASAPLGSAAVTVVNSGAPSGAVGSTLKIDFGPAGEDSTELSAHGGITTGISATDALVEARVRAANNDNSTDWDARIVLRGTETHWSINRDYVGLILDQSPRIVSVVNGSESVLATLPTVSNIASAWLQVRFQVLAGQVRAKVWRESDSEPGWTTTQQVGTLGSGEVGVDWTSFPFVGTSTGQEWFIDSFDVTTYSTGFKVNPDGSGEWPGLSDDSGLISATGSFTGGFRFVRIGNAVMVQGYTDRDDSFGTGSTNTGVLIPERFRPSAQVITAGMAGYNTTEQYRYFFNTDGVVNVQRTGVITTFMAYAGVYFID